MEKFPSAPKLSKVEQKTAALDKKNADWNDAEVEEKLLPKLLEVFFQNTEIDQTKLDKIISYVKDDPNEKRYRAEVIENIYRQYLHNGATR